MRKPLLYTIILTLLLTLLLTQRALPYQIGISVELFDIESGLSQSGVTALYLDSYGFLWIGTQDGLNRYDGYNYKAYRNNPLDTTTLSNNSILSITEDKGGNLWIATWSGLSLFKRGAETFKNYRHNPNDPNTLSSNRVFNVFQDSYGMIWVKTLDAIDRIDPTSQSIVRYPHFSDPFTFYSDNNDFALFEDSSNRFWVGTKDGLLLFDRELGLFKRYTSDPSNPKSLTSNRIKDIIEDSNGKLWVATDKGLNKFIPEKEVFVRFEHNPKMNRSLPHNKVNILFVASNEKLFIGTENGLCSYDPISNDFTSYIQFSKGRGVYSSNVTSIIEDNSQILWIGTQSGLVKWDKKALKFNKYSKSNNGKNLFSNNSIASIKLDKNGFLWVGTWGSGLHLYDRKTNKVTRYSQQLSPPFNIANDYVHEIYGTQNGDLIIGTRNGVQRFDPRTKRFTDFFRALGIDPSSLFLENRIHGILEDGLGGMWFATRIGLHLLKNNEIVSFYHNPSDVQSLSSSEIHCIELDGKYLWVGTFNGLNRLNIENQEIKRYYRKQNYFKGDLISNDIVCLKLDSKGFLWVGSPSGLHRYDKSTDTFDILYTEADGLPNNLIYAIEEDNKGNIWVSTNWGIAIIDTESHSILSYGVSDGLQSYEFNAGASDKSSDGEIFFGGISGFNSFYPDSIKQNTNVPKIAITAFEVNGPQGLLTIPVVGKSEIVLGQNFSLINIEFSALDFTHPEKNTYQYKLEGLGNEWINLGTKHSATFSNLREGVYLFKVKGANSDNVWNEEGASLRIVVKTYFWRSRVAFWAYGIILILSIYLFLKTRTRMLRKTSRLLKEREFSMSEIEKQKEELLIQNKSITDSINYAKRIQEALIPSEQHFKRILPDSFILHLPKDIVSGDFYWINETKNKIFVAAIDCTGHGVPGAFMSIIGVELLRNITSIMGINDASEILNRLNKGVYETFSKGVGDQNLNVKDGMDVSFCVIDKEQNILQFSGAFSNLYLIRESKIIEIKGDRYSVGTGGETDNPLFNSHLVTIHPDDMIYMFTDGYIDQFGGPEGKKYKYRRFRHLLLSVHKYPLEIQRKYLLGSINEWKGKLEQVDDILIIGIKPDLSCLF